ncbi:DUF4238 domain-containing protein [Bradyrhizobium sp. Arg314]
MTTPKFEKQNHHYVPQHWQRRFRDNGNQLYGRTKSNVRIVSTKKTMQVDWLYTIFDDQWRPSDALEDAFSVDEGFDDQLLKRLDTPSYVTTAGDEAQLCALLGSQASRHPDMLQRGPTLSREFGVLLASAHDHTLEAFQDLCAQHGISPSDAQDCYLTLKTRTKEQLAVELANMLQLSPQSPQLPVQDAIRAAPHIEAAIAGMQLCLIDALSPLAFVLGDTPIPQSDLGLGFSVALSKSLAVIATPAGITKSPMTRRMATQQEVDAINRTQFDNALDTVVGPSAALLRSL